MMEALYVGQLSSNYPDLLLGMPRNWGSLQEVTKSDFFQ